MATMQSSGSGQASRDPDRGDAARPRDALIDTIVRVLVVQAIALAILWFLQARYGF